MEKYIMKQVAVALFIFLLISCGPSKQELEKIANITCSIMLETRNMDSAVRVRELNQARMKIGGEPFLDGDEVIKIALEYGVCKELVLNENFTESLQYNIEAKEKQLDAMRRAAEQRLAAENLAAEQRLAAEKLAKEQQLEQLAAEKLAKEQQLAQIRKSFMTTNGAKEGVVTTESGLQYKVLTAGTGPKPSANSTVEVHYAGRLLDGTEFDSSIKRGVPVKFGVTQVIPGWTEALQLMPEGSRWEVYIPDNLAYGDTGQGPIGPNEILIFYIELLKSNVTSQ